MGATNGAVIMHRAPQHWFRGTLWLANFLPQEKWPQAHKDFISCDRERGNMKSCYSAWVACTEIIPEALPGFLQQPQWCEQQHTCMLTRPVSSTSLLQHNKWDWRRSITFSPRGMAGWWNWSTQGLEFMAWCVWVSPYSLLMKQLPSSKGLLGYSCCSWCEQPAQEGTQTVLGCHRVPPSFLPSKSGLAVAGSSPALAGLA